MLWLVVTEFGICRRCWLSWILAIVLLATALVSCTTVPWTWILLDNPLALATLDDWPSFYAFRSIKRCYCFFGGAEPPCAWYSTRVAYMQFCRVSLALYNSACYWVRLGLAPIPFCMIFLKPCLFAADVRFVRDSWVPLSGCLTWVVELIEACSIIFGLCNFFE